GESGVLGRDADLIGAEVGFPFELVIAHGELAVARLARHLHRDALLESLGIDGVTELYGGYDLFDLGLFRILIKLGACERRSKGRGIESELVILEPYMTGKKRSLHAKRVLLPHRPIGLRKENQLVIIVPVPRARDFGAQGDPGLKRLVLADLV